ncbi:hypothetical protein RCL1_005768 [Eukaryota sp. TZLM3-RCL]
MSSPFTESQLPIYQRASRVLPNSEKGLRSCLWCGLVKTEEQFVELGCDNCEFLNMEQDADRVAELTTNRFQGMVSTMNQTTWVSTYLGLDKMKAGVYALQILDDLPLDVYENYRDVSDAPPRSIVRTEE